MILPNTPHELVLQVMRNEAHKVEFFIKKEGSKLLSALERTPYALFPFLSYKIYTVPSSRNKYLVWFEVMDYRELKNGTFISGSCLIVNEEKGGITAYVQKISYDSEIKQHTSVLNIYTGHFFNRYRERFNWGNINTYELIARYLSRNGSLMTFLEFRKMNLKAEEYPDGAAAQVNDGVIFGTYTISKDIDGKPFNIVFHNTFIANQQLKDNQQKQLLSEDQIFFMVNQEFLKSNIFA